MQAQGAAFGRLCTRNLPDTTSRTVVLAASGASFSVRPSVGSAEAHDRAPETVSREARRRSYLFAPRGGLVVALPDSLQ